MFSTRPTTAVAICMSAIVAACGGGDEGTPATAGGSVESTKLTCDSAQFSSPANVPTTAQLETYSKTVYKGSKGDSATPVEFVLSSSGLFMMDNKTVDTKSMCYIETDKMIMVSWGGKTTVGAGVIYDNHLDLKEGGKVNGMVDGQIVSSK